MEQVRQDTVVIREAAHWRRLPFYFLGGAALLAALTIVFSRFELLYTTGPNLVMLGLLGGMSAFCAIYFALQELQIDGEGIRRRQITGWELWSWEAFASGRIARGVSPYYYVDQSNPKTPRKLNLWSLDEKDQKLVHERIREVWVHASLTLPRSISVQFWKIYKDKWLAEFSEDGIFQERQSTHEYLCRQWSEVTRVRVVRTTHDHHDFCSLEIEFADGAPIRLTTSDGKPNLWTGPAPQTVLAYVEAHVNSERIAPRALRGPAQSVAEADYRIGVEERCAKFWKWFGWLAVACMLGETANGIERTASRYGWNLTDWDIGTWLVVVVGALLFNVLGGWWQFRYLRTASEHDRQELMKTRAELARPNGLD
jgi:hypothetical protein